ncbi:MAG: hypothetical protein KJZ93_32630, partial [Caldilineaceae bacterium]|nr:hypothetical protein [Caldilineaceae bacterium]
MPYLTPSVAELHQRAATWYKQHGLLEEAMHHFLAAGDFEAAARLIGENFHSLWEYGEMPTPLRWFEALPAAFVHEQPQLCLWYAQVLSHT